jgi:hypothetical protein
MVTYFHVKNAASFSPLAVEGSLRVLLVAERPVSDVERHRVAKALVDAGASFVCAWGTDCEAWEWDVDGADIERNGENSNSVVMTTAHANEALEDALLFFKFCTFISDVGPDARTASVSNAAIDEGFDHSWIVHVADDADEHRFQHLYEKVKS